MINMIKLFYLLFWDRRFFDTYSEYFKADIDYQLAIGAVPSWWRNRTPSGDEGAMLIKTAPLRLLQRDASAAALGNFAEEHLARPEERTTEEFKAVRELMQEGFSATDQRFEEIKKHFEEMNGNIDKRFATVDQRFKDMNRRITAIQWMGTVAFVVFGVIISVVGLS